MTINKILGEELVNEQERLERFWLYCIFVASKNANHARDALNRFLRHKQAQDTPFEYLRGMLEECPHALRNALVASKIGQYARIERAVKETLHISISIRGVSIEHLEAIHGVGPKTARFFALHARGEEVAVLDTHILRWMREECGFKDLPSKTPRSGKNYRRIEKQFLALAKAHFPCLKVADADLLIWSEMSGRLQGEDLNE